MNDKPFTLDRITRMLIAVGITAIIIYLVIYLSDALIPFFVAWFIAYLINPIVLLVQKGLRIKAKLLAIILVLLFFLGVVAAFAWAFIPRFITEAEKLIALAGKMNLPDNIKLMIKDFQITSDMATKWLSMAWQLVSTSFDVVFMVFSVFFTFIYLVFMLKDFELLTDGALSLIPDRYKENSLIVIGDVKEGMSRYFRGQALVAACVGVLLAIGFSIVSLPMGIVLGLFIGMLNFVPYLQIVGLVPMAVVSLLQCSDTGENFWLVFGSALAVLAVVQLIQDLFLVPKIMGKVTGLNPAIILLSLSVWGLLLGVIGMIIALPLTTILLSYYKRFIVKR